MRKPVLRLLAVAAALSLVLGVYQAVALAACDNSYGTCKMIATYQQASTSGCWTYVSGPMKSCNQCGPNGYCVDPTAKMLCTQTNVDGFQRQTCDFTTCTGQCAGVANNQYQEATFKTLTGTPNALNQYGCVPQGST
jgi:hypothetical protein